MGYDPGADVQDVAASFTQYPIDLQAPGLSGLGYPGQGVIANLKAKYAAWKARRCGCPMMVPTVAPAAAAAAAGAMSGMYANRPYGLGTVPSVAYARVGAEVAPHMVSKEEMTAHLTAGAIPMADNFARSQAETTYHQWTDPWWGR